MQNIFFQGNSSTPTVNFDVNKGLIEISGRSIPENALKFYTPLIQWIKEYQKKPKQKTTVNFNIEYFNTSSSKSILQILKVLEQMYEAGFDIVLNWFYKDDDILEIGEDYQMLIHLPFNMIKTEQ
ncbi:MAG: nuclear pore complex subunit [Bacteroidetes bacterium]|nr:MAG: nuclear pore complex subunit [Bacteroidota bacterium]